MTTWRRLLVLLALLVSFAAAQAPQPTPAQPDTAPAKPITKAQARALFRDVDDILQFVSKDTGLPIHHSVKRRLITREQVEKFVSKRLKDDKEVKRLESAQLVLEKFGMIPPGYDLHREYLKLMSEQVAAFYDPRSKTVNLLDWVQPELQKPVLAHELTHALQDQAIDLDKWLRAGEDGKPLPDQQEQAVEEAQAARENVSEGQAMIAMLDYTLAPVGLNVLKAPESVDAMRASMATDTDLPIVAAAPIYLRESLYMPYTFGLDFARAVLQQRGTQSAFLGVLQHPPADTLQVMLPATYLDNQVVPPLTVPDLDKLIAPDYERYDFGGIGAFDIYLMTRQYSPKSAMDQYYPHWRGGYYLAVRSKANPKGPISLIFVSRWDAPDAALAFARLYGDYVPTRYPGASRLPASCPLSTAQTECSVREWDTLQSRVVIDVSPNQVLVLEGLNDSVTQRAISSLF